MTPLANVLRLTGLGGVCLGAVLLVAGCGQDKVTAYEVPKEDYSIKTPRQAARPEVKWTAPKGWVERPAQMGLVGFRVHGEEGKYADVRIIPLRAGEEIEKQSVNIWRDELGLKELPLEEIH